MSPSAERWARGRRARQAVARITRADGAGPRDRPTPATTCRAPFVALRLGPDGSVTPCGINTLGPFGVIPERSLREIWDGPEITAFRATLGGGTFPPGCTPCREANRVGDRHLSHAAVYDEFAARSDLQWPRRIEFALSNTCNLRCVQCNGDLSSAIRAQREHRPPLRSAYDDQFFEDIQGFLPHLEVATFIGGEPFLMRECRRVWDLMIEMGVSPSVHVTTNGTVWNDRVERVLHALQMDVAISIDAVSPETMAAIRVGADLDEVRTNRDRFLAATRSYGGDMTINYCVIPQNWHEYLPFLLEADEVGITVRDARVLSPHQFSLFSLPADQLRAVIDGMQQQRADSTVALGLNRATWDTTMADLTSHLDRIAQVEVPVSVAGRGPSPEPETETDADADEDAAPIVHDLARIFADVTARSGQPPVHIELTAGHIESITVPDWAEFLGLERCVDLDTTAMLDLVKAKLRAEVHLVASSTGDGLHRFRYRIEPDGDPIELEFLAVETEHERPGHADMLISRPAR